MTSGSSAFIALKKGQITPYHPYSKNGLVFDYGEEEKNDIIWP